MTNNTFAVVGKIINGRVSVIVASADRVVGYSKPLHTAPTVAPVAPTPSAPSFERNRIIRLMNQMEESTMRIQTTPSYVPMKKQPSIKKVDPIVEVPTFMQKNKEQQRAEQQASTYTPKQVYSNWFNRIHDIRE
jgi:hypothetical protein